MMCKRCVARGKTWEGSDPNCAFRDGTFSGDNWNCATMNELRDKAEENRIYNDDQNLGVITGPRGDYVVLSWYKSRGATEGAWLVSEGSMWPLTIVSAEALLG